MSATETKLVFRLTHSQYMALLDILIEHVQCPNRTESFLNFSTHPPTETSYGELLRLFGEMNEIEMGRES